MFCFRFSSFKTRWTIWPAEWTQSRSHQKKNFFLQKFILTFSNNILRDMKVVWFQVVFPIFNTKKLFLFISCHLSECSKKEKNIYYWTISILVQTNAFVQFWAVRNFKLLYESKICFSTKFSLFWQLTVEEMLYYLNYCVYGQYSDVNNVHQFWRLSYLVLFLFRY